ncbi:hypothetical protein L596_005671 [Steinernema carpocapsae]|nr:hypothetical protein L596_005671 [Steinernema carpocapsae]
MAAPNLPRIFYDLNFVKNRLLCYYYKRGVCTHGEYCHFSHDRALLCDTLAPEIDSSVYVDEEMAALLSPPPQPMFGFPIAYQPPPMETFHLEPIPCVYQALPRAPSKAHPPPAFAPLMRTVSARAPHYVAPVPLFHAPRLNMCFPRPRDNYPRMNGKERRQDNRDPQPWEGRRLRRKIAARQRHQDHEDNEINFSAFQDGQVDLHDYKAKISLHSLPQ